MNKNGLIVNDCGAEETQQTQFKKSAQREDDVPGLLLSERLGGCLNNPYIVVPMSPRAVNQYKAKVEDPIIAYLNASTYNPFEDSSISPPWSSKVLTTVFVMYPDEVSIRPAGFFFHSTIRGLVTVTSIYIPN
ncbi:hypothetical protein GE061_013892 [Apolygus lucorum]|uniref:Uncharacterized protein n=1 Tax=Apolygus lucorum TaxID=248454 RepID=A0A8S9XR43_APOLU|nr:hypothetical protein GE061_013892 [Apolygus lucorum]